MRRYDLKRSAGKNAKGWTWKDFMRTVVFLNAEPWEKSPFSTLPFFWISKMRHPYAFWSKHLKNLLFLFCIFSLGYSKVKKDEHVFLLHGLARTSSSMSGMEKFLQDHNFSVTNLDYPSRKFSISELAEQVRKKIAIEF